MRIVNKNFIMLVCCGVCRRNVISDMKSQQKLYFYYSLGELVSKYDTAFLLGFGSDFQRIIGAAKCLHAHAKIHL